MRDSTSPIEAGWKTYLKSAVFLAPAFLFSWVAALFILPKLETIWRDASLGVTPEFWTVHTPKLILRNGMTVLAVLAGSLIVLEFAVKAWPRFRRGTVGALVFVINTTALFTLTTMLISAMIAAPALAKAKTPAQFSPSLNRPVLHAAK